jgi:signal transduction histidine kinase
MSQEINRKQLEKTARQLSAATIRERDQLEALINSISDEIWFANAEGKFTLVNPSAALQFKVDKTDGIDVKKLAESLEVFHPNGSPRPIEEAPPLRALQGEVVRNMEEIVRIPATGELQYRQVSSTPVRDKAGSIIGSISVVRDITERKRAEERQREINEELNEYAYALTHNLKAPLRAIQNYVNFLFEDLADTFKAEHKKYLEGIKSAITLSNKQFEDLETLYRIKNHPVNFESFEMRELLDEIQSISKDTSDRKLIFSQDWPVFRAERLLLRQILIDLINNGFKFNHADIRRVEVGWQAAEGNGIEIYVRDNGIGIDPQYQQQIFDIFRRLHTESEYDGTGIGLAIAKRAVQKIGGRLRVESAVGEGSTFYINLPKSLLENDQT